MSNAAAMRKHIASVEAAKAKYANEHTAESADQFLEKITRDFKKVELLHPAPAELFTGMVNEVGFAAAVPQFRKEMVGRRVRDTAALDLIFAQWGALLYGGKIAKPEKPAKKTAPMSDSAKAAIREAELALRRARLAAEVREDAKEQVLMEFIMPNGLPLGKCTGTYLVRIAPRLGKGFAKIGVAAGKAVIETVPAAVKAVSAMERTLEKA